jgi:pyrimidine operon attenuation protein/uracil phosphoribosyltransferase
MKFQDLGLVLWWGVLDIWTVVLVNDALLVGRRIRLALMDGS